MRKALCVGIDYYERGNCLRACVSDADSIANALDRHEDGTKNFEIETLYGQTFTDLVPMGMDPDTEEIIYGHKIIGGESVTARELKCAVEDLFDPDKNLDVILFYFAGHGYCNANGGYLCASDGEDLSLDYLMKLVSNSRAKSKILILDSCFSGSAGKLFRDYSSLPEDTVIMAACTDRGTAVDGCFTPLMVDALEGGASNLMGEVSPGSIYSYIDQALGAWDQRPVFKANIESFVCLRKNEPGIKLNELRQITRIFPKPYEEKPLDPGYESDKRDVVDEEFVKADPEKEAVFAILRKYAAHNLVVPVNAPYMYQAAVHFKSCKLTALGRFYWRLVRTDRI